MKFSKNEIDKLILEELKSVINERNGRHPQEMTSDEIEAYAKATGPGGHLSTDKPDKPTVKQATVTTATEKGTTTAEEYAGLLNQLMVTMVAKGNVSQTNYIEGVNAFFEGLAPGVIRIIKQKLEALKQQSQE